LDAERVFISNLRSLVRQPHLLSRYTQVIASDSDVSVLRYGGDHPRQPAHGL